MEQTKYYLKMNISTQQLNTKHFFRNVINTSDARFLPIYLHTDVVIVEQSDS